MSDSSSRKKMILKELQMQNKIARKFLKRRNFAYKKAYKVLQSTETWTKAKRLLIEYFSLTRGVTYCIICGKGLDLNTSTMHHNTYDQKHLFNPKYINFLHNNCHYLYHEKFGTPEGKKHVRLFFGSRGLRIYSPKIGKIYLRYELIVLVVFIIGMVIYYWLFR